MEEPGGGHELIDATRFNRRKGWVSSENSLRILSNIGRGVWECGVIER